EFARPACADPMPRHEFHPADPCPGLGTQHDDRSVLDAVVGERVVRGIWRAWRGPGGTYCSMAKQVFGVEADRWSHLAGLAARLQDRLTAAGEQYPQVEVYEVGDWLPAYQRTARSEGELVWSRTPDPGIRVASLHDRFVGLPAGGKAEMIEDECE